MFQDIGPHRLHIEYEPRPVAAGDYLLFYREDCLLLGEGEHALPEWGALPKGCPQDGEGLIYLLSADDRGIFLSPNGAEAVDGFEYRNMLALRDLQPEWLAFAAATAVHLARWYDTHRYCGRCAGVMGRREGERALCCPDCGHVAYPQICPVVIVGVTDGDRLLLTRYANAGYRRYALVAGFMEVGETLEDTVRREVMEEVGLRVRNIRYYKSQPWAFSGSVLAGFFAEVDGDSAVTVDTRELSEAQWFHRGEIPAEDTTFSLTWDMIEAFRSGL